MIPDSRTSLPHFTISATQVAGEIKTGQAAAAGNATLAISAQATMRAQYKGLIIWVFSSDGAGAV